MNDPTSHGPRDAAIREIAKAHLDVDTLERRWSDALDFHDLAVWNVKAALEAAYDAGRSKRTPTRAKCPACGREIRITQI